MDTIPTDLDDKVLEQLGFEYVESGIENIKMPYYAKDAVVLFYNPPPSLPKNTYYIGFGFSYDGKYYAATFKWINKVEQLRVIYEATTGKKLINEPGQH